MASPRDHDDEANPVATDDPAVWERLVESLNPASMVVAIAGRMSPAANRCCEPEDLWQDALLTAWRDRRGFEWRGLTSFRRWLLQLADHQLQNRLRGQRTHKRGGGATPQPIDDSNCQPLHERTPSRAVVDAELRDHMLAALASLPPESRDVVRLRLFEGREILEIATELALGESAVRHRFRLGMALYQQRLGRVAGSSWQRAVSPTERPPSGA